ncbi:beta-ketoacyl synthase N-terminal-like domain-containing protein [Actinokineospora sp. 24-640]
MLSRDVTLGLPALGIGGLSENWLLREAGDLHWELVGEHFGVPVSALADEDGVRLLPAFVRVQVVAGSSLAGFAERDRARLTGQVSRVDDHTFVGDVRFETGADHVDVRLMTVFVRRGAGNVLVPGLPTLMGPPPGEPDPDAMEFHRSFRDRTDRAEAGRPLRTELHEPNPYIDHNGAGLLYFASYPHINDQCERRHLHGLLGVTGADWSAEAATVARDIVYLGNCGTGDTVRVRLNSCAFLPGHCVELLSTLLRERDGAVLAQVRTLKQVAPTSPFAALWAASDEVGSAQAPERSHRGKVLVNDLLPLLEQVLDLPVGTLAPDDDLRGRGLDSFALATFATTAARTFALDVDAATLFPATTATAMTDLLCGRDAQALPSPVTGSAATPIAIVGMAGRFPGADDINALWDLLGRDTDATGPIPADRWSTAEHPDLVDRAALLRDIRRFDHSFFRISPREAALMDPQQRLLLETSWAAVEDAGWDPTSLAGSRTGVYAGVCHTDYAAVVARRADRDEPYLGVAVSPSLVANRVSYVLGLRGPSVAIDTLCSSSLVALADAVAALRAGACEQALVGGVNVLCDPERHRAYHGAGVLSPRGRCHTFDDGADGYVRGEGVCAIVLKPLDHALADGDRVHAVVRGAAVNHGGRARSLTAPDRDAQADLLVAAHIDAGIDPLTVGYLEAHGTGTRLGDPIEVAGMRAAFDRLHGQWGRTPPSAPHCGVGSVKTRIGHLEAAAGLAGVVSVVLAMRHRTLTAPRNLTTPNPMLRLDGSPLRLQRERADWPEPPGGGPRRAGVSSFGMGGTNAHVVLEEAPTAAPAQPMDGPVVVPLSAYTAEALRDTATNLLDALAADDLPLASVARTLRDGRAPLPVRAAATVADNAELREFLRGVAAGHTEPAVDGTAARWVAGADVRWAEQPDAPTAPPVSLPTYPFRRERHWIDTAPATAKARGPAPTLLATRWETTAVTAGSAPDGPVVVLATPAALDVATLLAGDHGVVLAPGVPPPPAPAPAAIVDLVDWTDPGAFAGERISALRTLLAAHPRAGVRCVHAAGAASSPVAGLYRALSGEMPVVSARTVRVDGDTADLVAAVTAELATADRHTEVRYTGRERRVPALVAVPAGTGPDPLRDVGTEPVLITGGLGGIGLRLAAHVVGRGTRRLVLLSRTGRPVDAAGERALTDLSDRADVTVLAHALDDADSLRALLAPLGTPRAVFHCAGTIREPHSFLVGDQDAFDAVLAPKARGTEVLWEALRQDPPRLLVLFSSVAGAVPRLAAGRLDYATANAALDTFAEDTTTGDCSVRALRWPLWEGVGMGAHTSGAAAAGLPDLDADTALALLDSALRTPAPAVLLPCLLDPATDLSDLLSPPAPAHTAAPRPVPERTGMDLRALTAVVSRATRVDAALLGPGSVLADLGVDSLLMAVLVRALEAELGVPVDPGLLQEHPTLAGLAAALPAPERGAEPVPATRSAPVVVATPARAPTGPVPVAVIGLACRFPGAPDVAAFWDNLVSGRDCVTEVPAERWDTAALYDPRGGPGRSTSRWGGFLDDAALFDPAHFGFDEATAPHLDPLLRKTMEVAEECLRDAGYRDEEVRGARVGVFVGARAATYREHLRPLGRESVLGLNQNFIAAHLSQHFDLTGPNMVVDSACSSSLVSVHLAARSLATGESDLAMAGGADMLLDEEQYVMLSAMGALSPTGRCRAFDESADGFVPGEGAGMVLLKRLDDAERDGDRVLAVLESSGVNNDGRTMGRTTPNGKAQRALVTDVLARAGIDPRTIGHVEAHGTGTMIGDPIELRALTAAHRAATDDRGYCGIGSVKSSVGHLLSAAGIAGFIKTVLVLRHAMLVPTLHCDRPNPRFAFAGSPFFPVRGVRPLDTSRGPGRAAVSAFGFGGTNAHAVLRRGTPDTGRPPLPVPEYRRARYWHCPEGGPADRPRAASARRRSARLVLTPATAIGGAAHT